jgi:DNA primase
LTSGEGKLRALNFLMPYVQKIPNGLLRSEWATRIAQQLRIDEPVLRAALHKAASERRSEVKSNPELLGKVGKPAERRLIRMLVEAEQFQRELAEQLKQRRLYEGLETERIFAALMVAVLGDEPRPATEIASKLEERDRRVFFEILFEEALEGSRQVEQELARLQREIESNPSSNTLRELLTRKQELLKSRAG